MRDGTKLFTSVYVPKDRSTTYPIMLIRTPYSVAPYGVDQYRPTLGPSEHFMNDGFIVVYQDVRGRYMSEGEWMEVRPHNPAKKGPTDIDESTDTWDTIEWLVKNVPANNGKVGMWGISYPGFYVSAGMIDAHPALVAVSPQAPVTDYYLGDDSFHNGAFLLAHNFSFYVSFRPRPGGPAPPEPRARFEWGTPDGYEFYLKMGPLSNSNTKYLKGANPYWNINLDHPNYDAFWQARSIWKHFKAIKPAVLTVGGWYDAEDLQGPLRTYQTIEQTSPGATNTIVIGPWTHGSWSRGAGDKVGPVTFGAKASEWYRDHVEFPFFARHLKGRATEPLPEALMFVTGLNEWRRHETWPPKTAQKKTLYLAAGGSLGWQAPAADGFDEYVSDPGKPVPLVGYTAQNMPSNYMTADQRFAAQRPDVLVYQTPDACRGRDDRRPDRRRLARLDDRHGRGLRRQAHRRLSGRPSVTRAAGGCARLPGEDGRLSAAGARRAVPRQVPQQLREARALRARPAGDHLVCDAGRVSHLPPRPPCDGAGAELVVPVHRSQPADVRGHHQGDRGGLQEADAPRLPLGHSGVDASQCAIEP